MTVFLSFAAFVCGIFLVVIPIAVPVETPEPPQADSAPADYTNVADSTPVPVDYTEYDNNFSVVISRWTPSSSGERVQVSITNTGAETYNWAMLDIVFLDKSNNIIKTARGGAYSQIRPNDTVNIYMLAEGIENARGFVRSVTTDRFVYDPENGLTSNY
jgi:archaellum component FlaF (FlaF/FlaG flagellin family)